MNDSTGDIVDVAISLFFLILPVGLLVLGYLNGRRIERKHECQLDTREAQMRQIIQTNLRHLPAEMNCQRAELVAAEVVIASDYFKTFAAALRNFFGGEMKSLETLMVRGRREAKLRIVERAASMGASAVWNIRIETATVGRTSRRGKAPMAEIYAYGTALWLEPES